MSRIPQTFLQSPRLDRVRLRFRRRAGRRFPGQTPYSAHSTSQAAAIVSSASAGCAGQHAIHLGQPELGLVLWPLAGHRPGFFSEPCQQAFRPSRDDRLPARSRTGGDPAQPPRQGNHQARQGDQRNSRQESSHHGAPNRVQRFMGLTVDPLPGFRCSLGRGHLLLRSSSTSSGATRTVRPLRQTTSGWPCCLCRFTASRKAAFNASSIGFRSRKIDQCPFRTHSPCPTPLCDLVPHRLHLDLWDLYSGQTISTGGRVKKRVVSPPQTARSDRIRRHPITLSRRARCERERDDEEGLLGWACTTEASRRHQTRSANQATCDPGQTVSTKPKSNRSSRSFA